MDKKEEQTIEDIKKQALGLIERFVNGEDIGFAAKVLLEEYVCITSKYKKGDTVFYFDSDLQVVKAEVVSVNKKGVVYWYSLSEKSGRNCGWWREDLLFVSRDELKEHLEKVISRI